MSQTTLLTPELQRRICEAVLGGMHLEQAAEANGVSADTVQEWRRRGRGRAKNRPCNATYATFAEEVQKAEAACERSAVLFWHAAIPSDWKAARDFLARRFPGRWRESKRLDLSADEQATLVLDEVLGKLPEGKREQVLALLEGVLTDGE